MSRQQYFRSYGKENQRPNRRARKKAIQSRLKVCESRAKQRKRDARTEQYPATT